MGLMRGLLVAAAIVACACAASQERPQPRPPPHGPAPCDKAENVTTAVPTKWKPVPQAGVTVKSDTCSLLTSLSAECGNQTWENTCGYCQTASGNSLCVAGNKKGPDDPNQCCVLWKYDGFMFDYGGECKNERGSSNFTFNHGSHAHYQNEWDPVQGCKHVAYRLSEVAAASYPRASGSTVERRRFVASDVEAECLKRAHNKGVPAEKMCAKVRAVIMDEGVSVFQDLGRFCMSLYAESREKVSRAKYDIHPWPKEKKPSCNLNCGPYGRRAEPETNCSCNCIGNWGGQKCNQCMLEQASDCGSPEQVTRFERNSCRCVCRMPFWKDPATGKCSSKVNMTAIVEYSPGGNLKKATDVNQQVWAPYVETVDGGNGKNVSAMKTADVKARTTAEGGAADATGASMTRRRLLSAKRR